MRLSETSADMEREETRQRLIIDIEEAKRALRAAEDLADDRQYELNELQEELAEL